MVARHQSLLQGCVPRWLNHQGNSDCGGTNTFLHFCWHFSKQHSVVCQRASYAPRRGRALSVFGLCQCDCAREAFLMRGSFGWWPAIHSLARRPQQSGSSLAACRPAIDAFSLAAPDGVLAACGLLATCHPKRLAVSMSWFWPFVPAAAPA